MRSAKRARSSAVYCCCGCSCLEFASPAEVAALREVDNNVLLFEAFEAFGFLPLVVVVVVVAAAAPDARELLFRVMAPNAC